MVELCANEKIINQVEYLNMVVAKANLLDMIIAEGYILENTLRKCISKLDADDQELLVEMMELLWLTN